MKNNVNIRKLACCAALAFTSLSASAQTVTDPAQPSTDRMADTSSIRDQNRPSNSWIGLIGLVGLAGLLRRSQNSNIDEPARVRHA